MGKVLKSSFFDRDSFKVATELVGQTLCRQLGSHVERQTLTEIEVYDGFEDRASHAFEKSHRHGRSSIMFGPAGFWYVYLCYGAHWMLNIVTREPGYPAALLVRGTLEVTGPGRLTRSLKIDKSLNGKPAARASGLWIEESPHASQFKIQKTPRVGVDYAGPRWANKKFRLIGSRPER